MELVYLTVGIILVLIAFSQGHSLGKTKGEKVGMSNGRSKENARWKSLATMAKDNGEVWHDFTDPSNPIEIETFVPFLPPFPE